MVTVCYSNDRIISATPSQGAFLVQVSDPVVTEKCYKQEVGLHILGNQDMQIQY